MNSLGKLQKKIFYKHKVRIFSYHAAGIYNRRATTMQMTATIMPPNMLIQNHQEVSMTIDQQ